MTFDRDKLIDDLVIDEGARGDVYDDKNARRITPNTYVWGNPTTGIGHALNKSPWTPAQMRVICGWDIDSKTIPLYQQLGWLDGLSEGRQRALAALCFNLGANGLLQFRDFLTLLQEGHFGAAADDLLKTEWDRQVGANRSNRIASLIRAG